MYSTYVRSDNERMRFSYNGKATEAIKTEYLVFVEIKIDFAPSLLLSFATTPYH